MDVNGTQRIKKEQNDKETDKNSPKIQKVQKDKGLISKISLKAQNFRVQIVEKEDTFMTVLN